MFSTCPPRLGHNHRAHGTGRRYTVAMPAAHGDKNPGDPRRYLYRGLFLLVLPLITACARLAYYGQSIHGQYALLAARQPIAELLRDHATPEGLKQRLRTVNDILAFARGELHLPGHGSYRDYADLKRRYVVWNVFATPEFSLAPRRWCFLFVGCLDYRGYFSRRDASAFADQLRAQGLDVYMGGVAAYSTLGWFDDPVLNTMLTWHDARLAEVLLHELVHQKLYLPGDTAFNEALATSVAIYGVRRWLRQRGRGRELADYERHLTAQREFVRLLLATRRELQRLYDLPLVETRKRRRKTAVFEALRTRYQQWRHCRGDAGDYDAWMASSLNNAKLSAVATYHDYVGGFDRLREDAGNDMEEFFRRARALARRDTGERHARLREMARSGPPSPCARLVE